MTAINVDNLLINISKRHIKRQIPKQNMNKTILFDQMENRRVEWLICINKACETRN